MIRARKDCQRARRIVVKIGSALVAEGAGINRARIAALAEVLAALQDQGKELVVVSSGAVALGCARLGWRPDGLSVHEKQAAAAVGQPHLMRAWHEALAAHGIESAQLLLTKDDLRHRRRWLNAVNTARTLLAHQVLPIVNENDTVVVEEIKFGDNDRLAALVALLVDADLLVILTDVDGLFSADPRKDPTAARIGLVARITPELMAAAGGPGARIGTGGMRTKLEAARVATTGGVACAIIDGKDPARLHRLLAGDDVGTLFVSAVDRMRRRQQWIAHALPVRGRLFVDEGAARALIERGASLLPVGVVRIEGGFDKGDCVEIVAPQGLIARGLVNYSAEEARRIIGRPSQEIAAILGYADFASLVHRDNLVLLQGGDS